MWNFNDFRYQFADVCDSRFSPPHDHLMDTSLVFPGKQNKRCLGFRRQQIMAAVRVSRRAKG